MASLERDAKTVENQYVYAGVVFSVVEKCQNANPWSLCSAFLLQKKAEKLCPFFQVDDHESHACETDWMESLTFTYMNNIDTVNFAIYNFFYGFNFAREKQYVLWAFG